jgi:hypothetical protein
VNRNGTARELVNRWLNRWQSAGWHSLGWRARPGQPLWAPQPEPPIGCPSIPHYDINPCLKPARAFRSAVHGFSAARGRWLGQVVTDKRTEGPYAGGAARGSGPVRVVVVGMVGRKPHHPYGLPYAVWS